MFRTNYLVSTLLYVCIFLHAVILMVGGAYTYARVPFGFQLSDLLEIHRNPYDNFLVVCVVLVISASYELIEWGAALSLGQGADEFLGTQGDPWDTQSDMFFALIGSVGALVSFYKLHDDQIQRLAHASPH